MAGSATTTTTHVREDDKAAAREEAMAWLTSQLFWERRLREFIETKAVARASATMDQSNAVAAQAAMSHDRDDLDPGGGVADGMEAVGSLV